MRLCAGRVIGGLRYLSVPLHRDAIEELVAKVLGAAEIEQGSPVSADWVAVAMGLIDQIDRPYRKQEIRYFVKDGSAVVRYDDCEWLVPEDRTEPARLTSTFRWATSYSRIPITGWRRSVHLAVPLDVRPEFSIARILDRDDEVEWWARNDPPRLRIPTPVGNYEPDFVVRTKDGRMMILEVKGANHWKPPDSDPRVKARATDAWCAAASQPPGAEQWLHVVALDADIEQAATLHDVVSWRANQG